jgi:hypothetical protein
VAFLVLAISLYYTRSMCCKKSAPPKQEMTPQPGQTVPMGYMQNQPQQAVIYQPALPVAQAQVMQGHVMQPVQIQMQVQNPPRVQRWCVIPHFVILHVTHNARDCRGPAKCVGP